MSQRDTAKFNNRRRCNDLKIQTGVRDIQQGSEVLALYMQDQFNSHPYVVPKHH